MAIAPESRRSWTEPASQQPTIPPYFLRIEKPWGWEIRWTEDDRPYVGKIIHIHEGHRLSLQVHEAKTETWYLMTGKAAVLWDDKDGELVETVLQTGAGYSCPAGMRHRLIGITDCEIMEVSSPEVGTTFRLDDDYGRPDETEEERDARVSR